MLVEAPLTYTAPPFPDDAVHDVNVVSDPSDPAMDSDFPAPTDPQITAPFTELPEIERFANEQDVMVTSVDASNVITGLDTLTTVNGVISSDVRLIVPEEAEMREDVIEDGVKEMEMLSRVALPPPTLTIWQDAVSVKSICCRVRVEEEVAPTTKTAVDPSTVSAPRFLDGLEVRVDSRITVSSVDAMVVVLVSITVCGSSNNCICVTEVGFTVNA